MRTLVYDVIAYFARTNIVHAHTRKTDPVAHAIICRNTDARMQTHADAINSLNSVNYLNWVNTLITLITRTHAIIYRHTRTCAR